MQAANIKTLGETGLFRPLFLKLNICSGLSRLFRKKFFKIAGNVLWHQRPFTRAWYGTVLQRVPGRTNFVFTWFVNVDQRLKKAPENERWSQINPIKKKPNEMEKAGKNLTFLKAVVV